VAEIDPLTKPRLSLRLLPIAFWLALVALGNAMLNQYLSAERQESRAQWQSQLSLVASLQAQQAAEWVAQHRGTIEGVATNLSAQMYAQAVLAEPDPRASTSAEMTFLRNYFIVAAQQGGFALPVTPVSEVPANVPQPNRGQAGLALVNAQGTVFLATPELQDVSAAMALLPRGKQPALRETLMGKPVAAQGGAVVPFIAPMFPVQGEDSMPPLAYVAGIAPAQPLLDKLRMGGTEEPAQSALLIDHVGRMVERYSPDAQASSVRLRLEQDGAKAEMEALQRRGVMVQTQDASGAEVLAVAAQIGDTNWHVLRSVPTSLALGGMEQRITSLRLAYWMLALAVTLAVVLLWRHISGQQSERLLKEIYAHRALLQLVTDRIRARLLITDAEGKIAYANAKAGESWQMKPEMMKGKSLDDVIGREAAKPYRAAAEEAIRQQKPASQWQEWEEGGRLQARELESVPLASLPDASDKKVPHALLVEQDFTDMVQARRKQQQSLNKLVETLVMLVDQRDPSAAQQSAYVAQLCRKIAEAMELSPVEAQTAETAGRLRNLSKLMISQELLTSTRALSEEEKLQFDTSYDALLDYLKDVPFEGKVVETLRQSRESPDGSGPLGLRGETILPTAKIVAVANSFVALTSDRAFRKGKSVDEALEELRKESRTRYDAGVVSALAHYLDNQGGRSVLAVAAR
jgi:HD-GYP domain-containing protein (c-di-GMP phosphodiesterase class II)